MTNTSHVCGHPTGIKELFPGLFIIGLESSIHFIRSSIPFVRSSRGRSGVAEGHLQKTKEDNQSDNCENLHFVSRI